MTDRQGERIAKVMARAGLCSRREAEAWISQRRVEVDGVIIDTPAVKVGEDSKIRVDGESLPRKDKTRLWLFH